MGLVWHQVWHLVWHTHPPAGGGRSRPYVSLREGSPARARAGRSATPSGPIRDALLRAFLVIGDISAACAWTWPGVFPKADPVAVLVRYHSLRSNNLAGPLPPALGDLSRLGILQLDFNNLTGAPPLSLANLQYLEQLHIDNNAGLCASAPRG